MQNETDKIYSEILGEITPTRKERARIKALANELQRKVALASLEHNIEATVRTEGSVAKDTWLRGDPDIDTFIRLPADIPRKDLGKVSLKIAREATSGSKQIERFAEHPYLEAYVEGVRVNIVPCYDVKCGEWISATDRTPFHTDYVKNRLNRALRSEVRLLKKFMQGIGVYGAEIKIGGFSGYLCELLILRYKSFNETLKAFARLTRQIIIDLENYYHERENEIRLLFSQPLVMIDPVDKARNVASAVRSQKLHIFVAAARAFLKTPSLAFFNPPKTKPLPKEALTQKLENQGSEWVFLTCATTEAVPDVLWGQLYRTQRSLRKMVESNNFKVLADAVWSNEKTSSIFILNVEQSVLPRVKKHLGPPLVLESECENFLTKYVSGNDDVVSGPYIEDGRWVVKLQRRFTDIVELLNEKLKQGGGDVGVADIVSKALKKKFSVLVNGEISRAYNKDFAGFLTAFLSNKPFWLKNTDEPSKSKL